MILMILLSWNCYHRIKWVRSSMLLQAIFAFKTSKIFYTKKSGWLMTVVDCWMRRSKVMANVFWILINQLSTAQHCIVTIQHVQGSRQTSQLYAEVDILIKRKHVSTDSVFLQTQLLLTTLLTDDQVDTLENINDGQDMIEIVARCDWLS